MADAAPRTLRIEVLLILLVLGIAGAWYVGTARTLRVRLHPDICAANLRGTAQALHLYGQNGTAFPMATSMSRAGEMGFFANRITAPTHEAPPSPTTDMWMVVRTNYACPKQFICPSTVDTPDPAGDTSNYFDFADRKHLSYSYVYQYHPQRGPVGTNSEPWVPVLADSNPYLKGGIQRTAAIDRTSAGKGNSTNHRARDGQHVAFVDGHVSYMRTPLVPDAGSVPRLNKSIPPDNIYTTHADTEPSDPGNAPTWTRIQIGSKSDYCLVP